MKTDEGMDEEESADESSSETSADESKEGVKVPEEFQVKCHELLKDCDDMACLDYLSNSISTRRTELYKEEGKDSIGATPSKPVNKKKTPSKFSTADMPS